MVRNCDFTWYFRGHESLRNIDSYITKFYVHVPKDQYFPLQLGNNEKKRTIFTWLKGEQSVVKGSECSREKLYSLHWGIYHNNLIIIIVTIKPLLRAQLLLKISSPHLTFVFFSGRIVFFLGEL